MSRVGLNECAAWWAGRIMVGTLVHRAWSVDFSAITEVHAQRRVRRAETSTACTALDTEGQTGSSSCGVLRRTPSEPS
jgi:hypothetical protein